MKNKHNSKSQESRNYRSKVENIVMSRRIIHKLPRVIGIITGGIKSLSGVTSVCNIATISWWKLDQSLGSTKLHSSHFRITATVRSI